LQIGNNLIGPNSKRFQDVRTEGIDERNVSRIPAACDYYPADPRRVVARIECMPCTVQEDLDPGAEIHWIDDRNADVAEVAIDVACGNVEAAAERDCEMREVATDAHPLVECLECGSSRPGLHVVEADVAMDEVADRLRRIPTGCDTAEFIPRNLADRSVSQKRLPMR
jgi:hypothetical protein